MVKIGILGTTTWGTTLGLIASWRSIDVSQWARTDHEAREITSKGFNPRLPDVKLPENFNVTSDPYEAFASADLIIIASTSKSFRENVRRVALYFSKESLLLTATKGLELDSCLRMSQILQEECSQDSQDLICALSGPNLASEILEGKPSTSVIASQSQSSAIKAQSIIGFASFASIIHSALDPNDIHPRLIFEIFVFVFPIVSYFINYHFLNAYSLQYQKLDYK